MAVRNGSLGKWVVKFANAIFGFITALKEERSLLVHCFIAVSLLVMGVVGRKYVSTDGWAILSVVCVLGIVLELINTGIENLVDIVSFKYSINAKKVKDISAAATLVMSCGALAGGLLIVVPALMKLVENGG